MLMGPGMQAPVMMQPVFQNQNPMMAQIQNNLQGQFVQQAQTQGYQYYDPQNQR
jgi:hypothetical protein